MKLWQDAQFSRNRSPPRARSAPSSDSCAILPSASRDDRRPAAVGLRRRRLRASICASSKFGGLRAACGLAAHRGHAAGGHLEVDRGLADADEAGAAVGHALQVRAVAGDAGGVVELLAGAQQRRRPTRRRRRPAVPGSARRRGHRRRQSRSAAAARRRRRRSRAGGRCLAVAVDSARGLRHRVILTWSQCGTADADAALIGRSRSWRTARSTRCRRSASSRRRRSRRWPGPG